MTDFLVRRLIKDCGNINDPAVRARYGAVAGGVAVCIVDVLEAVQIHHQRKQPLPFTPD